MKVFLFTFLLLLAIAVFSCVYTATFGISISADHERWAQFFTMLSGLGALAAPIVAVLTIYFLNNQNKETIASTERSNHRRELFEELKHAATDHKELFSRKITPNDICLHLSQHVSVLGFEAHFDVNSVNSITIKNHRFSETIKLERMYNFAAWLAFMERVKEKTGINVFDDVTHTRFNRLTLEFSQQIEYVIVVAEECLKAEVNKETVRYHVAKCLSVAKCLERNGALDTQVLNRLNSVISSNTKA